VIVPQRRLRNQRIHEVKASFRTECHPQSDSTVQLHDRGRGNLGEGLVETGDAFPVRLLGGPGAGMTGGDRSLERIRTESPAKLIGPPERRQTALDEDPIPATSILIE